MVNVCGNNHTSTSYFVAHKLGRQLLAVGDVAHFFGDHAVARIVHLRKVAVRVFLLSPGKPLSARPGDAVAVALVAVCAIGGSHRVHTFLISKLYPSPIFPPNRANPECSVPPPGLLTCRAQLRISRYPKERPSYAFVSFLSATAALSCCQLGPIRSRQQAGSRLQPRHHRQDDRSLCGLLPIRLRKLDQEF